MSDGYAQADKYQNGNSNKRYTREEKKAARKLPIRFANIMKLNSNSEDEHDFYRRNISIQ